MFNKYKKKIQKNAEIIALFILVLITIISTSYYNFNKKKIYNNYKSVINNIYLKKSLNHAFNQLEPKFKTVNHIIAPGETFNKILEEYGVEKSEIEEIKKVISKKVNLNKLNTDHKIQFTIDQSNSVIKEFIFKISTKEKVYLSRKTETNKFEEKILVTTLKKNIVYSENIISKQLYETKSGCNPSDLAASSHTFACV